MLYRWRSTVFRAIGRLKRETLRIPFLKRKWERSYQHAIKQHAGQLPSLSPIDARVLTELQQKQVLITDTNTLSVPSTPSMLDAVGSIVKLAKTYSRTNRHLYDIPQELLMEYPEIYLWGLNERLLDIVENYIGLPVLYHGPLMRINFATGQVVGLRQWHIDPEDYRVLKIFVYLNDVTLNTGPFECISKDLSDSALRRLNYHSGFISEENFREVVAPETEWQACTGNQGTVVMADTGSIFHRAKAPWSADRFSLTFTYTSCRPKGMTRTWQHTHEWKTMLKKQLNDRQISCLNF